MLVDLVKDYLEYCDYELGNTPRTIYNYKYQFSLLIKFMGNVKIESITRTHIFNFFRNEEARGLAVSSVNTSRATIRAFFYYLQHVRIIQTGFDYRIIKNKKCDRPKVRVATEADLRKVLEVMESRHDRLLVMIMSQTCMRVGEIVHMKVEDINGCEISAIGKSRRVRPVSITGDLAEALQWYLEDEGIRSGYVFRSSRNKGWSVSGLRNHFVRRLKAHGIHAGFHWYRRGGATDMMRNGAGLFFLKEYLGHTDIRTTQRYLYLTDREKHENFKKYYKSELKPLELLT